MLLENQDKGNWDVVVVSGEGFIKGGDDKLSLRIEHAKRWREIWSTASLAGYGMLAVSLLFVVNARSKRRFEMRYKSFIIFLAIDNLHVATCERHNGHSSQV